MLQNTSLTGIRNKKYIEKKSGIPRIIGKVKAAGLREPEFIGGEVDLRINIYRGQTDVNGVKSGVDGVKNGDERAVMETLDHSQKLLKIVAENPTATQAQYAEQLGVSKRTVSRIFADLPLSHRNFISIVSLSSMTKIMV